MQCASIVCITIRAVLMVSSCGHSWEDLLEFVLRVGAWAYLEQA